jgi:hypothetical protein
VLFEDFEAPSDQALEESSFLERIFSAVRDRGGSPALDDSAGERRRRGDSRLIGRPIRLAQLGKIRGYVPKIGRNRRAGVDVLGVIERYW